MFRIKDLLTNLIVCIIGVLLQISFIIKDMKDTPSRAVGEFVKAYYSLEPEMTDRLCQDMKSAGDVDIVNKFIGFKKKEAHDRGFDISYMKYKLSHLNTVTKINDDITASVTITGSLRRNINPVFTLVAGIFSLGESREINETIHVLKEGNAWKVCDSYFSMDIN